MSLLFGCSQGATSRKHQRPLMPRVTCRCGEKLKVPPESPEHMDCTRCGARIRLRRPKPRRTDVSGDGFIRFSVPVRTPAEGAGGESTQSGKMSRLRAGRAGANIRSGTLKVDRQAEMTPTHGPRISMRMISPRLEKWSARHLANSGQAAGRSGKDRAGHPCFGSK